jgi:hypothetical protein
MPCFPAVFLRQAHQHRHKSIIGKDETALFIWGIGLHGDRLEAKLHAISQHWWEGSSNVTHHQPHFGLKSCWHGILGWLLAHSHDMGVSGKITFW